MRLSDPASTGHEAQPRRRTRVVSARVSMRQRLRDIWRYRELFTGLTRKELKVRYKNSVLGFVWSMLNPAMTLVVYYIVFQIILKNGIPVFPIFLIAGILVWNLFSSGSFSACGVIVNNSSIVKKVAFPREVLPLSSVGSAFVNFLLQSLVVVAFLVILRRGPAVAYVPLLIPAMVALLLFTAALGILLSAVNVRFRDTQHLLEIALQVWFWATPIIYPYRLVWDRAIHATGIARVFFYFYRLNPLTPIVLTFQRAIYGQTSPSSTGHSRVAILPDHAAPWWYLWQLLLVAGASVLLLWIGLRLFGRMERDFAEEL